MFKKNCQKIGIYKSTITILRYFKTMMEVDGLQPTNLSISKWSAPPPEPQHNIYKNGASIDRQNVVTRLLK